MQAATVVNAMGHRMLTKYSLLAWILAQITEWGRDFCGCRDRGPCGRRAATAARELSCVSTERGPTITEKEAC